MFSFLPQYLGLSWESHTCKARGLPLSCMTSPLPSFSCFNLLERTLAYNIDINKTTCDFCLYYWTLLLKMGHLWTISSKYHVHKSLIISGFLVLNILILSHGEKWPRNSNNFLCITYITKYLLKFDPGQKSYLNLYVLP